uniref:Fibrinogen alpha/beta/gamma chain coiled coil domain-containing protein n=1 Tax=Scophthalmus maximus TaxID=52904 RepID=A0A8D3B3A6_SCOMX
MKLLHVLVCLGLSCAAAADTVVNPRGARPVEMATRSEKCASQKEWPFCTDDDWGYKCPSGCRIQGLMDKNDHSLLKRIEKIRGILEQNTNKHHSTDQVSKQTYDYLKEKLTLDAGHDDSYYNLAQSLRQRITDMKIKIDRQLRILAALKDRVNDQVVEMKRLEVDIDIKLRSCKGSCRSYGEYQVDMESYEALDKQVNQLESKSGQRIETVGTLYVMKSRPLDAAVLDSVYKTGGGGGGDSTLASLKQDDVFFSVKSVQLVLEEEGSPTFPATISKDTGTAFSSSKSSTSSSSSSAAASSSSKSITELGGHGDSQPSSSSVSTKTTSCTKSTRRTIVHTKTGPVENVEEVYEGGPECQVIADSSKGGMGVFFPTLGSSSSSSSSFSSSLHTKTVHGGGTKGSLTGGTRDGFGLDPFGDLGAFMTDAAEEDVPDFHARSVKSTRVERQADYVGKVCLRLTQQNQDGRRPPSQSRTCRARPDAALCSDDDWVSKCPSGCRLQGLISQAEAELERKLRRVCTMAKSYKEASEKSMTGMTHVYNSNRRVIVSRYLSELKIAEDAEELARSLMALRKRSDGLSQQLAELHRNIRKQVEDLYRTEVDVDMKLRACRGSCQSALTFTVAHSTYQTFQTDMDEVVNQRSKVVTPPRDMARLTLRPVDMSPAPSAAYKTIPTVQRELLTQFEDIGQNRLVLEDLQ